MFSCQAFNVVYLLQCDTVQIFQIHTTKSDELPSMRRVHLGARNGICEMSRSSQFYDISLNTFVDMA